MKVCMLCYKSPSLFFVDILLVLDIWVKILEDLNLIPFNQYLKNVSLFKLSQAPVNTIFRTLNWRILPTYVGKFGIWSSNSYRKVKYMTFSLILPNLNIIPTCIIIRVILHTTLYVLASERENYGPSVHAERRLNCANSRAYKNPTHNQSLFTRGDT